MDWCIGWRSNMNSLQRHNQRELASALHQSLLVRSIELTPSHLVNVRMVDWEQYWDRCGAVAEEIRRLKGAWCAFIKSGYSAEHRSCYVAAYFILLRTCLHRFAHEEIDASMLRKVVGFETFSISCGRGRSVAGTFNVRNPAYLLSRLVLPNAREDPKFLPLICPPDIDDARAPLFCHYRRIGIWEGTGAQLFVYPVLEACDRSSSYWFIAELFMALTPKNDPWVQQRTRLLFDAGFADLVAPMMHTRIRLLDIACGSAKVTIGLCRKAFTKYGTSFDLTLVDVVRGSPSILTAFYRNPKVFANLVFRHESFYDWIDKIRGYSPCHFDVVLMMRICDVFSRFDIEALSHDEACALVGQGTGGPLVDWDVTFPAKLIEKNRFDKLYHHLRRSSYRSGVVYHQFSLSDYFLAMKLVLGEPAPSGESMIYAPFRRFDDRALVLPTGRSVIGELMKMTDKILIEDSQLTPGCLRKHIRSFGLESLTVTDLSHRKRGQGASVAIIGRRQSLGNSITTNLTSVAAGIATAK
jgi:hypothetical protein